MILLYLDHFTLILNDRISNQVYLVGKHSWHSQAVHVQVAGRGRNVNKQHAPTTASPTFPSKLATGLTTTAKPAAVAKSRQFTVISRYEKPYAERNAQSN